MYSKTVSAIYSSVAGWMYQRRLKRKELEAKTIPQGALFQPDGWGPVDNQKLPLRHFKLPAYPSPDYAEYSKDKTRPSYSPKSKKICDMARNSWASGDFKNAEVYYTRASEACPSNPEFIFEQAQLLWSEGRLVEARKLLEEALRMKPEFISARVSLFRICVQQGDFDTPRNNWLDIVRNRDSKHRDGLQSALNAEVLP